MVAARVDPFSDQAYGCDDRTNRALDSAKRASNPPDAIPTTGMLPVKLKIRSTSTIVRMNNSFCKVGLLYCLASFIAMKTGLNGRGMLSCKFLTIGLLEKPPKVGSRLIQAAIRGRYDRFWTPIDQR